MEVRLLSAAQIEIKKFKIIVIISILLVRRCFTMAGQAEVAKMVTALV